MNNPRLKQLQPQAGTAPPAAPPVSFVQGEALFLASLPVIDDVVGQVCRRHHLSPTEADDFRSDVRLRFIERDYDVLRRFEGRSSLATYVTVVTQRLYLDFRNRQWGKWRPSAEAKRLGPPAILLERFVSRDGWTVEQAAEALRVNHGVALDETLHQFSTRVASRGPSRTFVAEEEAAQIAGSGPAPDAKVVRAEQEFLAKRIQTALDRARQSLEAEDRLILKMRFEDAVPVADIARTLHLDQKRLYRRIERLLGQIGASLETDGIARSNVRALVAEGILTWDSHSVHESAAATGPMPGPAEETRGSWLRK
jgi:RNA polymerase sigma factor (sigma-70 family)